MDSKSHAVRLDKWLWAARFFKSRSLAQEAANGGKVEIDGVRAKPSREVIVGQELRITRPNGRYTVVVTKVSDRRGNGAAAAELYRETDESKAERERRSEMHRLSRRIAPEARPEGRDRALIRRLKEEP